MKQEDNRVGSGLGQELPTIVDGSLGKTEADVGHSEAPAETTAAIPGHEFADKTAAAASGEDSSHAAAQSQGGFNNFESTGLARNPGIEPGKAIYVGNLFFEVTEDALRQQFESFGEIASVRVVTDARGLSRGFGFVEFANVEDASAAVDKLDQKPLQGRRMAVQFNKPRDRPRSSPTQHQPSKTLFIGNMSFEMSDKDLSDLFRDMRNVMDVRVAIDRNTGQTRGFAHADFVDVESAKEAFDKLNGKIIYGRQLRLDYSSPSSIRTSQS